LLLGQANGYSDMLMQASRKTKDVKIQVGTSDGSPALENRLDGMFTTLDKACSSPIHKLVLKSFTFNTSLVCPAQCVGDI
jgi:hypothetical protein